MSGQSNSSPSLRVTPETVEDSTALATCPDKARNALKARGFRSLAFTPSLQEREGARMKIDALEGSKLSTVGETETS
eukprot:scaffold667048_cov47-Prasinocladus_malaysianus.AAC.1